MKCSGKFIVLRVNGTVDVVPFSGDTDDLFKTVKKSIGCDFVEPVYLGPDAGGNQLVMLCDEDAYGTHNGEWEKFANKVATRIYNHNDKKELHWVLGDVALVAQTNGDNDETGDEFVPFSESAVGSIGEMLEIVSKMAEKMVVPDRIPEPKCEVMGFDSMDDLVATLGTLGNI